MTSSSLRRPISWGEFTPQVSVSPENPESFVVEIFEYTQSQTILSGIGFDVERNVELDGELSDVVQGT